MQMTDMSFDAIDWSAVERTAHEGVTGTAYWRTRHSGDIRVRMV